MIKPTILLALAVASFSHACSNKNIADQVNAQKPETVALQPTAQAVKKKMRHKKLPEGVISADIVNFNQRLHLLTGKHQQGNKSLWYQSSGDGGKSWSAAVKILANEPLEARIGRGNDAQIAAQGDTIVATWMQRVEGARFNAGPMQAARSTDGGLTWQAANTPPDWKQGPHGYIEMAADEHAMHAVWLDNRAGASKVKASQGLRYAKSTDGGASWQANKTLDGLSCSCCWNTMKTDASHNAYVLYRDKQPSDLAIGRIDTQQQWQRLNNVGAFDWQFDGCPHIGGGLDFQHTAGEQRLHAIVGTGHPDHLGIHYLSSDDQGRHWSASRAFGDNSAIHADIAAHDDGRVVAVWDMMSDDGLAIFAAESTDRGSHWSQPRRVSKAGMRASHPRIVTTAAGFFTLWTESDGQHQNLATERL